MSEIYWICTNESLDLEVRYAAARQMQNARMPEREIKERKRYTVRERNFIRSSTPAKEAARLTDRTLCAVYNQRRKEMRKMYP